ncbi:MAG: hypothetical protein JEZ07_08375 [Phycisphaerae bacterium]|nr:hypothetical protein [Phycisphaerae bacterium]
MIILIVFTLVGITQRADAARFNVRRAQVTDQKAASYLRFNPFTTTTATKEEKATEVSEPISASGSPIIASKSTAYTPVYSAAPGEATFLTRQFDDEIIRTASYTPIVVNYRPVLRSPSRPTLF